MSEIILIVDDTPANIDVLRRMLEMEGYRISAAPSGIVALKIASRLKPALILLDVMMPGLSGYETCQRLRENPDTASTPIIFVTAKGDVEDVVCGFDAGANDYIAKPFRREEVLARVQTHLALYRRNQELKEQGDRLRAIVNNVADGILIFDSQGRIRFLNPAAEYQLGSHGGSLLGADLECVMDVAHAQRYREAALQAHPDFHGYREVTLLRRNGDSLLVDMAVSPASAGEPMFVGIFRDASERRGAEECLRQLALTDALTNVGNRRFFDMKLDEATRSHRKGGCGLALMLIDVDHFKAYNDHYGHQAGDDCLREIAAQLRRIASLPGAMVARYGGEEFATLISHADWCRAEDVAKALVTHIAERGLAHAASETAPVVTVSVGVACSGPDDIEEDGGRLLARADKALYTAKRNGRNRYCLASHASVGVTEVGLIRSAEV